MDSAGRGRAAHGLELSACDHTIQIPLAEDFVFVHEPLQRGALAGIETGDDEARSRPLVGRRQELEELLLRLARSRGGSFLITGYRGVGKTSFVNQVIHELRAGLAEATLGDDRPTELVDVHLSLARATDPMGILFHVIHGLHQRLKELRLLPRLAADLRAELELAWQRTSFKIATSRSQSSETDYGVEGSSLFGLVPTLSAKDTRSDQLDLQYLAYDSRAAERDLIRITQRLTGPFEPPRRLVDRVAFWRRRPAPWRLKVVLVFDELDKLQEAADQKGATPVDRLISVLKNLLTSSGICFLFVAGKDLEERWKQDVGAGDSIYESVFSFNRYLPALWEDANALVDALVEAPAGSDALERLGWRVPPGHEPADVLDDFRNFVAFHGRGIPRRSLRLLHGFVRWSGTGCVLAFHRRDWRSMRFYAGLEVLLKQQRDALLQLRDHATPPADRDHARLGLYYLVDWMLDQGEASFTPSEAVEASRRMSRKIAFVERLAVPVVRDLIELLVRERYLEKAAGTSLLKVAREGTPEPRYRIAPERLAQLGGAEQAPFPVASAPKPPTTIGRFTLHELIGEGGFGKVFRATDSASSRDVAVKVLAPDAAKSAGMRARFQREGAFLRRLNEPGHEGVVRFLDHGEAPGGELWAAMDFVEGVTLRDLLGAGALEVLEALAIARKAALAYGYVHGKGALRLDVKPANIVVDEGGRVVVIDFGIALLDGEGESAGDVEFVGTPAYVAPEQLPGGSRKVDARSDVYSLGVVLFEMLTGQRPFDVSEDLSALRARILEGAIARVGEGSTLPADVMELVLRAMAAEPASRFASMAELAQAIAALEAKLRSAAPPAPVVVTPAPPRPPADGPPPVAPPPFVGEPTAKAPAPAVPRRKGSTTIFPSPSAAMPGPSPVAKRARKDETKFAAREDLAQLEKLRRAAGKGTGEHVQRRPSRSSATGTLFVRRVSQDGSTVDQFDVPLAARMVIGRGQDCDVRLESTEVSRRHAELEWVADSGGRWRVRDLGSANGTTINLRAVRGEAFVTADDQIGIDEFVLRIDPAVVGSDAAE